VKTSRAGKQTKAYWRSEAHHYQQWRKEEPITIDDKNYGQHLIAVQRVHGFATGWIAGVAWARRQTKKSK
jgi:hypothetical protein